MDKQSIVQLALDELPSLKDKYIIANHKIVSVTEFATTTLINYLSDSVTKEIVVAFLTTKLNNQIKTFDEVSSLYIEAFIKENNVNEENAEWLRTVAVPNLTEQFLVKYGSSVISLPEYYQKVLSMNNTEVQESTLEDKQETCSYYLDNYLPEELHDFYVDYLGMSIGEYILNELPNQMVDYYQVSINGELHTVEDVILDLSSQVIKRKEQLDQEINLDDEIADEEPTVPIQEELAVEDQIQHKHESDRVIDVSEIKMELNKDNVLEITGNIPIIITELSDDDRNYLIHDGENQNNDLQAAILSNLKVAIMKTTSKQGLDSLVAQLTSLKVKLEGVDKYTSMISSIEDLIDQRTKSLIINSSNKPDYLDAMIGGITTLSMYDLSDEDKLNEVDYYITKMEMEIAEKGIKDTQLRSQINALKKKVEVARIRKSTHSFDRDDFMTKADLEAGAYEIRNNNIELATNAYDNNFFAGKQVKQEQTIRSFTDFINAAKIDEKDKDKYIEIANMDIYKEKGIGRVA